MLALPMNNRKRLLSFTQDLEDGELPEAETAVKYNDGYDENLLGDAADRIRLAGLSELEREKELYSRSVKREDQMFKWGIKNMLLEKNKSESITEIAVTVKERSNTRKLHLEAQRVANKKRSALDQLVAQRNNKRTRGDGEVVNHITADEDEEQAQDQVIKSSEKDSTVKKLRLKARDVYSEDSGGSTDEEPNEAVMLVESLMELGKAILTRYQLEDFLEKPIFDQTVIGCFVRVSIGATLDEQSAVYRLSEIVALVPTELEYQVGCRKTKRMLQVKHGNYEHTFHMNVVSNQPVTSSEFTHFVEACQRDAQPLPSLKRISEKQKDIEKATNYAFTEGDVELIVQTKRQAGQKLVSAAYRKVCLIMERDMAIDSNDVEKANQLEREIKQIDGQSLTEPQREKRVQYMSSNAKPMPVQTTPAHAVAKPRSCSKKIDWQQYMRQRYRKIASLQRQQGTMALEPVEPDCCSSPAAQPDSKPENAEKTEKEPEQLKSNIDVDQLDLYELHSFQIRLDVSKLLKFNAIFSESNARCLL